MDVSRRLFVLGAGITADQGSGATNPLTDAHSVSNDNNLSFLASGAISFINGDTGELIPASTAPAVIPAMKSFQIAVGSQGISDKIVRRSVRAEYKAGVAGTAEIVTLGTTSAGGTLGLPAAAKGNVLGVLIIVKGDDNIHVNLLKKRIEYVMKQGDTNAAAVAALVTKINADTEIAKYLTAAGIQTNTGISFTAATKRLRLSVGGYESLADATFYNDGTGEGVAWIAPFGDYIHLKRLENEFLPQEGKSSRNYLAEELYSKPSAVADDIYDMYILTWESEHNSGIKTQNPMTKTLILAIPDGLAAGADGALGRADIEDMLEALVDTSTVAVENDGLS